MGSDTVYSLEKNHLVINNKYVLDLAVLTKKWATNSKFMLSESSILWLYYKLMLKIDFLVIHIEFKSRQS